MRNLKHSRRLILSAVGIFPLLSIVFSMFFLYSGYVEASGPTFTTIKGSAARWILGAHLVGHHSNGDQITIGLMLRTSNPAGQQSLIASLYDKKSPNYHHWLSTGEFMARFAPVTSDVAAAESFLTHAGLHLLASPDATLLLASGTVSQVEAAFHTTINDYRVTDGSIYYGNNTDVQIPTSLSNAVLGVFGLSSMNSMKPLDVTDYTPGQGAPPPSPYGGGPFGSGLTPSQIAGIYDSSRVYSNLHDTGQGVTLALFELAGYRASDITFYENYYHLRHVPLVNKPVLGGATTHNGAGEVELDIELQIAMAPGVSNLLVYGSPNTELGLLAQYLQIAKDNQADAISTSWGIICEYVVNSQITLAENQIFLQMAAQGQSLFAASGDAGAFSCTAGGITLPLPLALQLGDPNNQPYNTAVGGTSFRKPNKGLVVFDPGKNMHPTYPGTSAEGTWNEACSLSDCLGSGGGVSRIWAEPDYAANLSTGQPLPGVVEPAYSQAGSYCGQQPGDLCRENPDVSLNADPGTGYSIYCTDPGDPSCTVGEFTSQPGWIRFGGTSCAAPLWAGIAALFDSYHGARLGLANYYLYSFDSASGYPSQFHDITLYTNGYYPAGPAYDMATGIGTPDIYNLIKP